MGSQYAGNPASFPDDFTIPDDADEFDASTFDVPFEALGDRTASLRATQQARVDVLTAASGTWTCPLHVTQITIEAFGGGGGGGGGGSGDETSPTSRRALGGGGGGASRKSIRRKTVVPGTVYDYATGAGGAGGAGGPPPMDGTMGRAGDLGVDGDDASFDGLVVARGGGGGCAANGPFQGTEETAPFGAYVFGGTSPKAGNTPDLSTALRASFSTDEAFGVNEGEGGTGGGNFRAGDGGGSREGYAGGARGATGATATNRGGGGGGGGGAGPGGAGGAGGAGSAGTTGTNTAGNAGTSAAANSGAGGGGGGASGQGGTATASGASGGAGGSGQITIIYFGAQAVIT